MTLICTLTLVHETEDSAYYAESPALEGAVLLGALTVRKWGLPATHADRAQADTGIV